MRSRNTLIAALLTAVALGTASSATAAPPDDATYDGECSFAAASETTQVVFPAGPGHHEGVLVGVVVASSPTLGHNPVQATVQCHIEIGGVRVSSTPVGGPTPGVAATAGPVSYFLTDIDPEPRVCTEVTLNDAHNQGPDHYYTCESVSEATVPAQEIWDAIRDLGLCDLPVVDLVCDLLEAIRVILITNLPIQD